MPLGAIALRLARQAPIQSPAIHALERRAEHILNAPPR
jgi:hypothetical protein